MRAYIRDLPGEARTMQVSGVHAFLLFVRANADVNRPRLLLTSCRRVSWGWEKLHAAATREMVRALPSKRGNTNVSRNERNPAQSVTPTIRLR